MSVKGWSIYFHTLDILGFCVLSVVVLSLPTLGWPIVSSGLVLL